MEQGRGPNSLIVMKMKYWTKRGGGRRVSLHIHTRSVMAGGGGQMQTGVGEEDVCVTANGAPRYESACLSSRTGDNATRMASARTS